MRLLMIVKKSLYISLFLLFNCSIKMISTESSYHSSFLKEIKKCVETNNDHKCKELILLTERKQLDEFYKGNLKCQTSILGLQTEIIKNIYFERSKDNIFEKIIPSVIKNC